MTQRVASLCLSLCLLLVCGCASLHVVTPALSHQSSAPSPLASPAALAAEPEEAAALEAAEEAPETDPFFEGLEEEPLVSEELPEAHPDEVLSSGTKEADRIKEQARSIGAEIKEDVSFGIPITLNERVAYYLDYFQTVARQRFSTWLARSTMYLPLMQETFRSQGLPEDLVYLALIESGFNPRAVSRSGAVGPWQFISGTGHRYGLKQDHWVDERRDPEKATLAAAAYLTDLYSEFGSWYLAAAAYNCGEGRIRRAIRDYNTEDYWAICDYEAVSRETRNYVPQMIAALLIAKEPARYGFGDLCYETPPDWDTVELERPADLNLIAELCGTEYQLLKDLNPELRRGWTPPATHAAYRLRVPLGSKEQLVARLAERKGRAVGFLEHKVRRGETLSRIARAYGCSTTALAEANDLANKSRLRRGQKLLIPAGPAALALAATPEKVATKKTYSVRRGDNLYRIARSFGTDVPSLRDLNPGLDEVLHPGQRLIVGKSRRVLAEDEAPKARQITYRVKPGDTLSKIARRYNVGVKDLRSWNGLRKGSLIYPGDRLRLMASGA